MPDTTSLLEARFRVVFTGPLQTLSVSDGVQSLLGYSPDSFLNSDVSLPGLIHPGDQDIADSLFVSTDGSPTGTFNIRVRQACGRIRCVRGEYSKFAEENGQPAGVEVLLQDAKSLWRSQGDQTMMANFKAMMDNTDDFIFFKDRNHVFTGASQTLVELTAPVEHWTDLIGKTDYDVFPEEYADIYYLLEKQVFSGMPVAHEIQEILRKDGRKGWVDNRKYPIRDDSGAIVGLFGIARDISELKRTEAALAESEQRFRSIFQNVPRISVQGYDREHRVIFWNPASEQLYGFSQDQALGHYLEELIIPQSMQNEVSRFVSAWIDGGPEIPAAELTLQRADKKPVEVFSSHVMLRNKAGEPEMYCIDVDLTEQKRVAADLVEEQQFSRSLIDNLPGIFYLYSYPDNRLVLWNKQHELLLGYRPEEMKGRSVLDWHLPEARNAVLATVEEVMKTGHASIEAPLLAKDGRRVYFALNGVRFDTHDQTYLMGVGTDISERRKIEEALRISEERHRLLADNASDVIWTIDPEGHPTYISPSIEHLLGFSVQEMMQKSMEACFTAESFPVVKEGMEKLVTAITAGLPAADFRGELEQYRKDGSTVWTEITATAMVDAAGTFISILGVTRDISQRRQMEEQVRLLAFHDPLTNLPNRRLLHDRLNQVLASSKRSGLFGAVMFIDLDNFKPLNDTYGHEIGDLLLVEVARRLNSCVRAMDTVARYGGDEFVVMISELEDDRPGSTAMASLIAEKIRSNLADSYRLAVKNEGGVRETLEYHCTASIGLSVFLGEEATQEDILKWADAAMYHAKVKGNNSVQISNSVSSRALTGGGIASNFMQLVWHPAYESGNVVIDDQHRLLFNDANKILGAMLSERPVDETAELIDHLMGDVIRHFKDEEAIIVAAGFSGADVHATIHNQLLEHALTVVGRFHSGTLGIGELFQFLGYDLVAQHMLGADREFFACLQGRKAVI